MMFAEVIEQITRGGVEIKGLKISGITFHPRKRFSCRRVGAEDPGYSYQILDDGQPIATAVAEFMAQGIVDSLNARGLPDAPGCFVCITKSDGPTTDDDRVLIQHLPAISFGGNASGEVCVKCGGHNLRQSGTCKTCMDCGDAGGCG